MYSIYQLVDKRTKGQRGKEKKTKGHRDILTKKRTKGQRDKGTDGQRNKGKRDKGTMGQWDQGRL